MALLTKKELQTIENQMYNKARDIDVALFNYSCGTMPSSYVGFALTLYQNKDGGFGHGLHNDNLNPNSTVFQTLDALKYISLSSLSLDDEENQTMVKKIFNYLYNKNTNYETYDESNLKYACASCYSNKDYSINLLPEVVGRTIELLNEKSPYYRKALALLSKIDTQLLNKDSLSYLELYGYNILYKALINKNISYNEEAYYYYLKLRNKFIDNLNINEYNYYYILELLDDKSEFESKINESLNMMKNELKPHGLYETTTSWDNTYPEAESASLKWLGTRTVFNIILFKKFKEIEE